MRQFNILLAVCTLFSFSIGALGEDTMAHRSESELPAAVLQGKWTLGGSISLSKASGKQNDENLRYSFGPVFGYFITDGFNLGADLFFSNNSNDDLIATIGPIFEWHYFSFGRSTLDLEGGLAIGLTDQTVDSILRFGAGYNYFVSDSVSIGPVLSWRQVRSPGSTYNRINILATVQAYL